ncbi:hypothetical protein KUV28_15070 [Ferrimonas balearica]|nr:hypothetical protein [Ferrimonas balearica]
MIFDYSAPTAHEDILAYAEANPSELPEIIAQLEADRATRLAEAAQHGDRATRLAATADLIDAWLEAEQKAA